MEQKKIVFGAGCFWGVEKSFRSLDGVVDAQVGYAGGSKENPSYKEVCTGTTGHAEVVEVTYDSEKISLEDLTQHFFSIHNSTTENRQGPDVGSQYRSIVFYTNEEEKMILEKVRNSLPNNDEVVTQIVPYVPFYRAKEYHQQYIQKSGGHGVCF